MHTYKHACTTCTAHIHTLHTRTLYTVNTYIHKKTDRQMDRLTDCGHAYPAGQLSQLGNSVMDFMSLALPSTFASPADW